MDNINIQNTINDYSTLTLTYLQKQYHFICIQQQTQQYHALIYSWKLFPVNQTGFIIEVLSPSLNIQLNKLILKSNLYSNATGFKFKIHPLSGIFFLEYSFFIFCHKNSKIQKQKLISSISSNIVQTIYKNLGILKALVKILDFIHQGSVLQGKNQQIQQLIRYGFNSQLYAWNSPIQNTLTNLINIKKNQLIKKKCKIEKQVWSDYQSDEQVYESETCSNQIQEQSYQNLQINQEQVQLSQFYKRRRKLYKDLCINRQNKQGVSVNEGILNQNNLLVKYFISENQDLQLFNKYLKINPHKQTNSKQNNLTIFIKQNNSCFNCQSVNSTDDNQIYNYSLNINNFLTVNSQSISKQSRWLLIHKIINIVYKDFLKNDLKTKKVYIQKSYFKISKGFNLYQINHQIASQYSLLSQKKTYQKNQFKTASNNTAEQTKSQQFQKEEFQQRKLASICLSLICSIIFPQKYYFGRTKYKNQKFNIKEQNKQNVISNLDKWLQGAQYKFLQVNLDVQLIVLFMHQRIKYIADKGPFGDWIVIISNKIKEIVQNSKI